MISAGNETFVIELDEPWSYWFEGGERRDAPLSQAHLDATSHIHGALRILVAGRPLPSLGYFGPHDVCVNDWLEELSSMRAVLDDEVDGTYTYDEGEQGQPAYVFRRRAEEVMVSVEEGTGGGSAVSTWQEIPCRWEDVADAVVTFRSALAELVHREAGVAGARWLERRGISPSVD